MDQCSFQRSGLWRGTHLAITLQAKALGNQLHDLEMCQGMEKLLKECAKSEYPHLDTTLVSRMAPIS